MSATTPAIPEQQFARHLDRAVRALQLGDALADTIRPSRRAAAADAAIVVYGQGLYWALTADARDVPETLAEAWAAARPDLLAAGARPEAIARAQEALARSLVDRRMMDEREQEADLGAARVVLRGLIWALRARRPAPRIISWRRWTRYGVIAAGGVVVLALAVWLLTPKDLAAGRPWLASSVSPDCDPSAGMCQGSPTAIFFHTRQEESPWVRIDLGAPKTFSSITVTNRRDCCEDRAVPLVLEVGTDGQHFLKVAEQKGPFTEWKATFHKVTARYVRARVPRNTILHLERIAVR